MTQFGLKEPDEEVFTKQDADDLMLFYLTTKSRSIG